MSFFQFKSFLMSFYICAMQTAPNYRAFLWSPSKDEVVKSPSWSLRTIMWLLSSPTTVVFFRNFIGNALFQYIYICLLMCYYSAWLMSNMGGLLFSLNRQMYIVLTVIQNFWHSLLLVFLYLFIHSSYFFTVTLWTNF